MLCIKHTIFHHQAFSRQMICPFHGIEATISVRKQHVGVRDCIWSLSQLSYPKEFQEVWTVLLTSLSHWPTTTDNKFTPSNCEGQTQQKHTGIIYTGRIHVDMVHLLEISQTLFMTKHISPIIKYSRHVHV